VANDKWLDDDDMDNWQNLGDVPITSSETPVQDDVPIDNTTTHFTGTDDLLEDSNSKGTFPNGFNGTRHQQGPNQQQIPSSRRLRSADEVVLMIQNTEKLLEKLSDKLSDNETVVTAKSWLSVIFSRTNQTFASVKQNIQDVNDLLEDLLATQKGTSPGRKGPPDNQSSMESLSTSEPTPAPPMPPQSNPRKPNNEARLQVSEESDDSSTYSLDTTMQQTYSA